MVTTEGETSFTLRGNAATLGGKPDLIALRDDLAVIIDAKTGKPSPSHTVQVMLYQYAVPRAMEQYKGLNFSGQVAYANHCVDIPADEVNEDFVKSMRSLVQRLGAETAARKIPSAGECRFCDISSVDWRERVEGKLHGKMGTTDDF